jgi:DNA topoisomerase-1
LRYVRDDLPGIARRRKGRGFAYISSSGRAIRDQRTRDRIQDLAIPPAWEKVWICPWKDGHIQATGRDQRNRKQYVYHPRWQEAASAIKYDRLVHFGKALPRLRPRLQRDYSTGDCRTRLLAGMVRLLDASLIRIGNEEYLENGSHGLTTLLDKHVKVGRQAVTIQFRGKGGLQRQVSIEDRELARFLCECRRVQGARLFTYKSDDGGCCEVHAGDLNDYLSQISGEDFTAKDFRTWKGTCTVAWQLYPYRGETSLRRRKRQIVEAIDAAAEILGNTRSVCRAHYVHPQLLSLYEEGAMAKACTGLCFRPRKWLTKDEQLTLHLLKSLRPT